MFSQNFQIHSRARTEGDFKIFSAPYQHCGSFVLEEYSTFWGSTRNQHSTCWNFGLSSVIVAGVSVQVLRLWIYGQKIQWSMHKSQANSPFSAEIINYCELCRISNKNRIRFYLRTHFIKFQPKSKSIFQNQVFERDWSPLHTPSRDKPYLSSLLRYKEIGGIELSVQNDAYNISEIIIPPSFWTESSISQKSICWATWPIQAKSAFVSGSIGVVGG